VHGTGGVCRRFIRMTGLQEAPVVFSGRIEPSPRGSRVKAKA